MFLYVYRLAFVLNVCVVTEAHDLRLHNLDLEDIRRRHRSRPFALPPHIAEIVARYMEGPTPDEGYVVFNPLADRGLFTFRGEYFIYARQVLGPLMDFTCRYMTVGELRQMWADSDDSSSDAETVEIRPRHRHPFDSDDADSYPGYLSRDSDSEEESVQDFVVDVEFWGDIHNGENIGNGAQGDGGSETSGIFSDSDITMSPVSMVSQTSEDGYNTMRDGDSDMSDEL